MIAKDRKAILTESADYNGIDFVEVANTAQTKLRVHFFNTVPLQGTLAGLPTITGGETIQSVTVNPIQASDWSWDDDHLVLALSVLAPGDFSNYTLSMTSRRLDSQFNQSVFSFKARCPSLLDCKTPPAKCPPPASNAPPIDYLSKDFLGFRQALLDFSALRYPAWQERSEADFGVMFLEALSSLADDLSYQQDRIQAEAGLETATQRRSVVSLARLVDYEPPPATSATVLLQFDVTPVTTFVKDGTMAVAVMPDGSSVEFETGASLQSRLNNPASGCVTNAAWNRNAIQPYWFDDSQRCLRVGATQMYVQGRGFNFYGGQALLLDTAGASTADPPVRQIVHLVLGTPAVELCDPLFLTQTDPSSPPTPTPVTQIFWESADQLAADHDLTKTIMAGNIISATQGLTVPTEPFAIPSPPSLPQGIPLAVVRTGPNDKPGQPSFQYLYTLGNSPLAWLAQTDPTLSPLPEIVLLGQAPFGEKVPWPFLTSLLEAGASDPAFTLDASLYSQIATMTDPPVAQTVFAPLYAVKDYNGDGGDTIRFGDGTFGPMPLDGSQFSVTYRFGRGSAGNVAPDAITQVGTNATGVLRVTNPKAASGGADAETLQHVARMAPQAFRAVQYRAVLPSDYEAAAETLPWVLRAGTEFRWTGSWLTVFTTPDPLNSQQATLQQQTQLINLLNRYRIAGYESYVPKAQYVSLDIQVEVCALPTAFEGEVEAALLTALGSGAGGFFNSNNFAFGQPLCLSDLETAAQGAPGVAGVLCVLYRERGSLTGMTKLKGAVKVAPDQIIRCDNDPSAPNNGSLKIIVKGGK
jgi:hypothetical protein